MSDTKQKNPADELVGRQSEEIHGITAEYQEKQVGITDANLLAQSQRECSTKIREACQRHIVEANELSRKLAQEALERTGQQAKSKPVNPGRPIMTMDEIAAAERV